MLKRNKKIAQICALAMCINLIQGSFVKGYANETETNNDVSEVESSVNLEADDKSENEADNIESEANEADNIESEATDDILSNEENLEDIVDDEVIDETKSETIDEEEYEEVEETDSYNSSSDMVIINFNQYEKLSDNTLRLINGRDGIRGNIEIPESAEIDGETYTVTEIGERAFFGVCDLETVKLPSSVTKIGKNAFTACQLLREVSGLEGVVDIDKEAFNLCSSLKDISSLKNVRHIGEHAFYGCTSLEAIPSLENLESMDYGTFENCTSLKNIELGNKITYMPEKALSDTDSISVYTIPASVESIEKNSFGTDTTSKKFIAGSEAVKNLLINIGINSSCIKLENYSWNSNNQCSIDGLTYAVNGSDTVYVSNCEENTYEEITIPKTITVDNKEYTVTEVGRNAFYQKNNIKKVTLPETIKKIGNYAFGYCSQLTYVNLDDVDYIESSAFSYCSQLSNINIENATFIGSGAFHSCDNLDKIKVGNKENTTLDSPLCIDGKNLSFVSVGKGVSEIGWNSFEFKGNDGLCILSENIKKIDHGAFYISYGSKVKFIVGSEEVKNLLINSGVEGNNISIEVMDFDKAQEYAKYYFSESITIDGIKYIKNENNTAELMDCSDNYYSYYSVPDFIYVNDEICNVTKIKSNSFASYYNLKELEIGNNVETIESNIFGEDTNPESNYNKNSVSKITIPASVKNIAKGAFSKCPSSCEFYVDSQEVKELVKNSGIDESHIYVNDAWEYNAGQDRYQYRDKANSVVYSKIDDNSVKVSSIYHSNATINKDRYIPDTLTIEGKQYNVTTIGEEVLSTLWNENHMSIVFPDSIKNIEDDAFRTVPEKVSVILPDEITDMGIGQFENCFGVDKIKLPKKLQVLNERFIYRSDNLPEIVWPEDLKKINDFSFMSGNYDNLVTSIEMPDSIEEIGHSCFCINGENTEVPMTVKFSSNLKKIGMGSFCQLNIEKLELPDNLEEIGLSAFAQCRNLKEIKLPANLKRLGTISDVYVPGMSEGGTFGNNKDLEKIELPDSLEYMGPSSFYGCENLKEVKLSSNLKIIEGHSFYNCKSLKEIDIPDSVEEIGKYTFYGCNDLIFNVKSERVKNLLLNCGADIDESRINVITNEITNEWNYYDDKYYWLDKNTGVNYCRLSDDSVEIESICTHGEYEDVYIPETITVEGKQYNVTSIGRNALSDDVYKKIVFPNSINHIEDYALQNIPLSVEEIVLPDEVTDMGEGQFIGCQNLKKVHLPKNLKVLNSYFYDDCAVLPEMELPEGIREINDHSFNVKSIGESKSLEISNNIEKIGCHCFNWIEDVESITLPENISEIGKNSFTDCENLKEIKFGSNLRFIGTCKESDNCDYGAFSHNRSLERLELPESLEVIDDYAFSYDFSLKEVQLPYNLKKLGNGVFSSCSELKTIDIPESVEEIGDYAFGNCNDLIFNVRSERVKNLLLNCNAGIDESRINVIE